MTGASPVGRCQPTSASAARTSSRRASAAPASQHAWIAARLLVLVVRARLRRLARRRADRRARRRCRSATSPCAGTSGCRPARCWRWSTACAAGTSSPSRSTSGSSGCCRRRGSRSATLRRVLPSTVEITRPRAAADGHRPPRQRAVPGRRARRCRRRVRTGLRRPRPADHRRPRRAPPQDGGSMDRRRARRVRRPRDRRRWRRGPRSADEVSQIDVTRPARRGGDARGRHGAAAARRGATSSSGCSSTSISAPALRERVAGDRLRGLAVRRTVVRAAARARP